MPGDSEGQACVTLVSSTLNSSPGAVDVGDAASVTNDGSGEGPRSNSAVAAASFASAQALTRRFVLRRTLRSIPGFV
jgi:hypothetical protein